MKRTTIALKCEWGRQTEGSQGRKSFAFVSRQKRITLDGSHFYIDLVFYHTVLKCFVLIDLKTGKLTHQDLGQLQLYVNYFDRSRSKEKGGQKPFDLPIPANLP